MSSAGVPSQAGVRDESTYFTHPEILRDHHMALACHSSAPRAHTEALKAQALKLRTIDNHWPFCQVCTLPPALASQQEMHRRGVRQDFDQVPSRKNQSHFGAWLRCSECTGALHYKCLGKQRQARILNDVNEERYDQAPRLHKPEPLTGLPPDMVREDTPCNMCYEEPALCCICGLDPVGRTSQEADAKWGEESDDDVFKLGDYARPVFRCRRCMRSVHYECLARVYQGAGSQGDTSSAVLTNKSEHAASYRAQLLHHWTCPDCSQWPTVERILAWRKVSPERAEMLRSVNYGKTQEKLDLIVREYFVKFRGMSWRDAAWVPFSWLERVYPSGLAKFRTHGPMFLPDPLWYSPSVKDWDRTQYKKVYHTDTWEQLDHDPSRPWEQYTTPKPASVKTQGRSSQPSLNEESKKRPEEDPLAARLIPTGWMIPERILDVFYCPDVVRSRDLAQMGVTLTERVMPILRKRPMGLPPYPVMGLMHISQLDGGPLVSPANAEKTFHYVAWALLKWQGLGYREASWTQITTDQIHDPTYGAQLLEAYYDHLNARDVSIPLQGFPFGGSAGRFPGGLIEGGTAAAFEDGASSGNSIENVFDRYLARALTGSGERRLASYQKIALLQMIQWWHARTSFILADDAGLGKAVEIIALIGWLSTCLDVAPFLIAVPRHTISHWVRLLRLWLPNLNTIAYHGSSESRRVLDEYELLHPASAALNPGAGLSALKAEAIVADEEDDDALASLARIPRWQLLVVHASIFFAHTSLVQTDAIQSHCRVVLYDGPVPDTPSFLSKLFTFLERPASIPIPLDPSPRQVHILQQLLESRFLRRTRNYALSQPTVAEYVVATALQPVQKRVCKATHELYSESLKKLCEPLGHSNPHTTTRALKVVLLDLLRVSQGAFLCGNRTLHPEHVSNPSVRQLMQGSAKLALIRPLLKELSKGNHRTVVFSSFRMQLDMINQVLVEDEISFVRLDRDMGSRDVDDRVQEWKGASEIRSTRNPRPTVALVHSRLSAVGLDLSAADTIIVCISIPRAFLCLCKFAGQDLVPGVNASNLTYVWRFDQKKPLLILHLVTRNSPESFWADWTIDQERGKTQPSTPAGQPPVTARHFADLAPETLEQAIKHGQSELWSEGGCEPTPSDPVYSAKSIQDLLCLREQGEQVPASLQDRVRAVPPREPPRDPGVR